MVVTSFTFVYGVLVPYEKIWEATHPGEPYDADVSHEWVICYLAYMSRAGPCPRYLDKFNADVKKRFREHPLFSQECFSMNIPHDQLYEHKNAKQDKHDYYAVIGTKVVSGNASLLFKDFKLNTEGSGLKYEQLKEKFKGTVLYECMSEKPELMIVQNDCDCCT